MAHYAFLDENNIVTEVIVGIDETERIEGLSPEEWYGNFRGQVCKRTSYNTLGNTHKTGGVPFRKNYAGIGFTYDVDRDVFIAPQPFPSWILDEETCQWDSPVTRPTFDPEDPKYYEWDEATTSWVEVQ